MKISVEEFDEMFDSGEVDMTPYLDMSTFRRPRHEAKRVNVDFPQWMVDSLDQEAARIGVTRQSIIKTWIAERIDLLNRAAM